MKKLNLAVIQMKVVADKKSNIKKAEEMIKQAVENNAEFIILPEMFNCPYQTDLFPLYAEEENGYTYQQLSRIAEENNVYLVGGSLPESDGNKIYNTSYVFNNTGNKIGKHRKIHLFDIDIEGGQTFKESDTLHKGSGIRVIETPFVKLGVIICYDLRFPELSRLLVQKGAEIIIVPGAFNMTTGPAHWEILFRTRALDNQVYMIGAAPARNEESSYISYANSIIADPWGRVTNRLDREEGILYEELDLGLIYQIRAELPLLKHLRTDLYNITHIARI